MLDLKVVTVASNNLLRSGRLQESFWSRIWQRNKTVIYKVVAYRRWLLMRSGRYGRIDCIMINEMFTCILNQNCQNKAEFAVPIFLGKVIEKHVVYYKFTDLKRRFSGQLINTPALFLKRTSICKIYYSSLPRLSLLFVALTWVVDPSSLAPSPLPLSHPILVNIW